MNKIILSLVLILVLVFPSIALGNLLPNGDMEVVQLLSNGSYETGDPPAGWSIWHQGSIAQSGTYAKVGTYSIAVTRSGTDAYAYQPVSGLVSSTAHTLGAWVYSGTANCARVAVDDGTRVNFSTYHTGSSDWEWLHVTDTIYSGTTSARVLMCVENVAQTCYFDGAVFAEDEYHNDTLPTGIVTSGMVMYGDYSSHNGTYTSDGITHTVTGGDFTPSGYTANGNDYINCGNVANFTSPFTLSMWVNLANLNDKPIIDKNYTTNGYMIWFQSGANTFDFYINNGLQARSPIVTSGLFYYVTAVCDGVANQIYVNTIAGTSANNNIPVGNANNLTIGLDVIGRFYYGVIDSVICYNRALTPAEITQNYQAGLASGRYSIDGTTESPKDLPIAWVSSGTQQFPNQLLENPVHVYSGTYSLALERSGVDILSSGTVPWVADYYGELMEASCWAYSGTPNAARIYIYDGVNGYYSDYHGGTGWEELTVTHNLAMTANQLGLRLENLADGVVYFDAADLDYDTTTLCTGSIGGIVEGMYEPGESGTIYSQLFDTDNHPLNTSKVEYILYDVDGNVIDSGILPYIAGTQGLYGLDFTAPDTEGTYALAIESNIPFLCSSTDLQVRTGSNWWEDNIMLIALAILAAALLVAGYALHKGDLTIGGAIGFILAGGYAYSQSETGISPVGMALILMGLVFMLAGATMWRNRNEQQEDDEIDLDGEDEDDSLFRDRSTKLSRERTARLRGPFAEKRRLRREFRDIDG